MHFAASMVSKRRLSRNTALSRIESPWSKIVRYSECTEPDRHGCPGGEQRGRAVVVVPSPAASTMALGPPASTEMTSPAPPAKLPGAVTVCVAGSAATDHESSWAMNASL